MGIKVYATIADGGTGDGERFELGALEGVERMITRTDLAVFFEAVAKAFREDRPDDYVEVPEPEPGQGWGAS